MACDDRQLTQAQRAAAFQQQRTGVVRAVRPFSGSATVENLIDYINRELGPAVRDSRQAVNDVYLQVADNAPSANPLAFYFSTSTAAADPTVGRIRLNASPQNTATIMRVSQSNGRLVDVQPWLDVMAGGPTTPLGVVTLVDAINPARFIRWDLNTMTDQGAYWDLGITVIESSDPDPFVEDEGVVVGFISGVSAAGSTIPVAALSPIARDTFVGNIGTTTAPPVAVPLADVDSTSIIYDATSHTFQRAALTGFAAAAQNTNATTSAEPIVTYSASANMSAERVTTSSTSVTVSTSVASQIEFQRAALTGAIAAAANANTTLFSGIRDNGSAESDRTNLNFLSTASITAVVTDDAANDELEITCTIPNAGVTNALLANMAAGTQKGRQIDSGAAGAPVDLTGAEQGENIRFSTSQTTSATGTQNDFVLNDNVSELACSGAAVTFTGFTRNTVSAAGKPFFLRVGSGCTVTLAHNTTSTANCQISCPDEVDFVMQERSCVWLIESDDKWRVLSVPEQGRLIARTVYASGSGTHTYDARCRRAVVRGKAGGGGGGGAGAPDSNVASGGGEGGYFELNITSVPTSSAYAVGAGGAGGAGGNPGSAGSSGGNTTFHDGGTTRTASGGTGGQVGGVLPESGDGGAAPSLGGTVVVAIRGQGGFYGVLITIAGAYGGHGGGSGGGKGGRGGTDGTSAEAGGDAGANTGAGGGGASTGFTGTDVDGGDGGTGWILVEEYS